MKALVIRQPWASLIAHGIKTIETRGFAPRTSIRPGEQIAIIAGKKLPPKGLSLGWEWATGTESTGPAKHADDADGECPCPDPDEGIWSDECKELNEWVPALMRDAGAHGWSIVDQLHFGAVVAIVTFDEALPCVDYMGDRPLSDHITATEPGCTAHPFAAVQQYQGWPLAGRPAYRTSAVTDQLPLGDFTPGRYGWLLSNPARLTSPVPCPAIRPDGTRTVMQGVFTLPDDVLAAVLPQLP
jgi:hypothetical protein